MKALKSTGDGGRLTVFLSGKIYIVKVCTSQANILSEFFFTVALTQSLNAIPEDIVRSLSPPYGTWRHLS